MEKEKIFKIGDKVKYNGFMMICEGTVEQVMDTDLSVNWKDTGLGKPKEKIIPKLLVENLTQHINVVDYTKEMFAVINTNTQTFNIYHSEVEMKEDLTGILSSYNNHNYVLCKLTPMTMFKKEVKFIEEAIKQ